MRIARKLMLLALAAAAVMAFSASSAFALGDIQVVNEKTGAACGDTIATGCTIHAKGTGKFEYHEPIFGIEVDEATCVVEVTMKVTGSGSSSVTNSTYAPGDANCIATGGNPAVIKNCELPWAGSGEEDGTTGVVNSTGELCVIAAETGVTCEGDIGFDIVEQAAEHYDVNFSVSYPGSDGGDCEFIVSLEVESTVTTNATPHINHL